jgi:hypothetical protein
VPKVKMIARKIANPRGVWKGNKKRRKKEEE